MTEMHSSLSLSSVALFVPMRLLLLKESAILRPHVFRNFLLPFLGHMGRVRLNTKSTRAHYRSFQGRSLLMEAKCVDIVRTIYTGINGKTASFEVHTNYKVAERGLEIVSHTTNCKTNGIFF